MEAEQLAEIELCDAASELHEALMSGAPEPLVALLLTRYDAAFDGWVDASGHELERSSFEPRAP